MSVVNKVVVKDVAYDIEDAKTKQALSEEVARAQAKENELEKELEDVQSRLNTTESVTEVSWGASSNMNSLTTAGVYNIKGERTNANDNLPISNSNPGHTVSGRLIVLDSSIDGTGDSQDKCITQLLTLSNRTGEDGDTYIRTASGASLDSLTWMPWATQQTNVNVGQVTSLDSFIDNGIYSGVWVKNAAQVETFVMIVINNYAAATQAGVPKSITQFKYSIAVGGSMPIYETRVGISENEWKPWEEIASKDIISQMISNEISKVIDSAPDAFDTLKEVADWILNDKTGAAAMAKAISENKTAIEAEATRAQEAESGLSDAIRLNYEDITNLQSNVEKNAMQYNTLGVGLYKDKATVYGRSLDGTPREVDFPAATSESAGVMSAEDKVALDTATSRAMRALFVAAGAEYNDTDSAIEKTAPWETEEKWRLEDDGTYTYWEEPAIVEHLPKHYYLNGLGDITEEQMMTIYIETFPMTKQSEWLNSLRGITVRTNLFPKFFYAAQIVKKIDAAFYNAQIDVIRTCHTDNVVTILNTGFLLNSCSVKYVYGVWDIKSFDGFVSYASNNTNLRQIKLKDLKHNAKIFDNSRHIYKRSILYLIQNAAPTSAITITLHPDAYARIANQPDILEALEAQPLVTLVSA